MNWPVNPLRGNQTKPLTGEPCAGNPPARFGGGRGRNQSALPTPINAFLSCRGNITASSLSSHSLAPGHYSLATRHSPLATRHSLLATRYSPLAGYSHPPTARLAKTERGPISTSGPTILVWHQTARSLRKNQSVCPRSPPPNRRRRPCSRDRRRSTPVALGPPAGWPKAVVPILSLLSLVSRYSPKQFSPKTSVMRGLT